MTIKVGGVPATAPQIVQLNADLGQLNASQVAGFEDGELRTASGTVYSLSELLPSATTITGPGTYNVAGAGAEFAGWYCQTANGNVTVYNALTATGTPVISAEATVTGPRPLMGAGTTGRDTFAGGVTFVLSGTAVLRVYASVV